MTAPSSTRARAPDFAALETEVIQLHPGLLNRSNHHDLPATSDIKRRRNLSSPVRRLPFHISEPLPQAPVC